MKSSREHVLHDVLGILEHLADDWEYDGELDETTNLIVDLGLESLDIVVLGAAVQEHYGRVLPFSEYFAEIGQRHGGDILIGEWVDFIHTHLEDAPALIASEREVR